MDRGLRNNVASNIIIGGDNKLKIGSHLAPFRLTWKNKASCVQNQFNAHEIVMQKI